MISIIFYIYIYNFIYIYIKPFINKITFSESWKTFIIMHKESKKEKFNKKIKKAQNKKTIE